MNPESALEMTLDDVIQASHGSGNRGRGRGAASAGRGRKGGKPVGAAADPPSSVAGGHTSAPATTAIPAAAPAKSSENTLDMSLDEVIEKTQKGSKGGKGGKGQRKGGKGAGRLTRAVFLGSAQKKAEATSNDGNLKQAKGQGRGKGLLGIRGKTFNRWVAGRGRGSLIKKNNEPETSWGSQGKGQSKNAASQSQSGKDRGGWNDKRTGKSWDSYGGQSSNWWQEKSQKKDSNAWSQGKTGIAKYIQQRQDTPKDDGGQWDSNWKQKQTKKGNNDWGSSEADSNSWNKKKGGSWNKDKSDEDWWSSARTTKSWADRGNTASGGKWAQHAKTNSDVRRDAQAKQDGGSWADKSRDDRRGDTRNKSWGEDARSDHRNTSKMNAWSKDPKDDGRDRGGRGTGDTGGSSRGLKRSYGETGGESSSRGKKIKVTNIPHDLDRVDIKEAFENEVGKILRCELDRGTAWISFNRDGDAQKAVDTFDRGELNGNTITVTVAR